MQSVPRSFNKKHLNNKQMVMLPFKNNLWPIKLLYNSNSTFLSEGWAVFARVSKLVAGDVCVFELIDKKKAVLHVHIFRS